MATLTPELCEATLTARIEETLGKLARVRATTGDKLETQSLIVAVKTMSELLIDLDAFEMSHHLPVAPRIMLWDAIEADTGAELRAAIDVLTAAVRQILTLHRDKPIPF